jgi:hypothetical protein
MAFPDVQSQTYPKVGSIMIACAKAIPLPYEPFLTIMKYYIITTIHIVRVPFSAYSHPST